MPRSHVMVRQIRPDEFGKAAAALDPSGRFWPNSVLTLPLSRLMVAEKWVDGSPQTILYQPLYPSLSLGSFVPLEDATSPDISCALAAITREAYSRANDWGMAELLVSTAHPETARFALNHGFEEAHPTYRMEVRK
jgi:hypothetical protein